MASRNLPSLLLRTLLNPASSSPSSSSTATLLTTTATPRSHNPNPPATTQQQQQPQRRPLSTATARQSPPYKDDQDRNELKPRSAEGTGSAYDSEVAELREAFNPATTRPEDEFENAARENGGLNGGNRLEASGANQRISKPLGDDPGGDKPMPGQKDKQARSSTHGGNKHGKVGKPKGIEGEAEDLPEER